MSGDIYYTNVALLVAGDAYADTSQNALAITHSGVTLSTSYQSTIKTTIAFPRGIQGDVLYATALENTAIASGVDFTVELKAVVLPNATSQALFSTRSDTSGGIFLGISNTGKVFLRAWAGGLLKIELDSEHSVEFNSLHEISFGRKNGLWSLYVDGVPQRDILHVRQWSGGIDGGSRYYLGCSPRTSALVGALSQVRVTLGVMRYSSQYVPSALAYDAFSSHPNIVFGELSRTVALQDQTFTAGVLLTNADAASIRAVSAGGTQIGSGWSIQPIPDSLGHWRINGLAPHELVNFHLIVTATSSPRYGSLSLDHDYLVTNTADGLLTGEQLMLSLSGKLAMWLDASDASSLYAVGNQVSYWEDKATGVTFTPLANRVAPTIDTGAFNKNSVVFSSTSVCGMQAPQPLAIMDSEGYGTLFIVGRYSGLQLAQGGGQFQLSLVADATLANGVPVWALTTDDVGSTGARVVIGDGHAPATTLVTDEQISSGDTFLVVCRSTSTKALVYVNQQLTASLAENAPWQLANGAVGFIGGAKAPTGSFISIAEIVGISGEISERQQEQIESYLNHKWSLYPAVPYAQTPSSLVGYAGDQYQATVMIFDATSVRVEAGAGTNWSLVPDTSNTPNLYRLTGIMPTVIQDFSITIRSFNGAVAGVETFTLVTLVAPTKPLILTPTPHHCAVNTYYVGYVEIFNATSVTITANGGAHWELMVDPFGQSHRYIIRGLTPLVVGTLRLTISATNNTSSVPITVTSAFELTLLVDPVLLSTPYPLDLTGLLPSNKVSYETQSLTKDNGLLQQFVIPTSGPFFGESMVVGYYGPDAQIHLATRGVDYEFVLEYHDISSVSQSPVYAGLVFVQTRAFNNLVLTYQTVGGNFSLNKKKALEDLFLHLKDPLFHTWDGLVDAPAFYPVQKHQLNLTTHSFGYSEILTAISGVGAALHIDTDTDVVPLLAHSVVTTNPHGVSSATIGLERVQNYPIATSAQATDITNTQSYLTPKTAQLAIALSNPVATETIAGRVRLDLGDSATMVGESGAALTSAGLASLLDWRKANPLSGYVNSLPNNWGLTPAQTSPNPLVFPIYWNEVRYHTLQAFRYAVETAVGISAIMYHQPTSTFYFPVGTQIPELITHQTPTGAVMRRMRVTDVVTSSLLVRA